jgi:hypothetical protein
MKSTVYFLINKIAHILPGGYIQDPKKKTDEKKYVMKDIHLTCPLVSSDF